MTTERDHRLEDALAFQQGLLDPSARVAFAAHLEGCAECQATLERVAAFLPSVQHALVPALASPAQALTMAKAALSAPRPRRAWVFGLAFALAAVLVFVLASLAARPRVKHVTLPELKGEFAAPSPGGPVSPDAGQGIVR